jgi:hypothetical protein
MTYCIVWAYYLYKYKYCIIIILDEFREQLLSSMVQVLAFLAGMVVLVVRIQYKYTYFSPCDLQMRYSSLSRERPLLSRYKHVAVVQVLADSTKSFYR